MPLVRTNIQINYQKAGLGSRKQGRCVSKTKIIILDEYWWKMQIFTQLVVLCCRKWVSQLYIKRTVRPQVLTLNAAYSVKRFYMFSRQKLSQNQQHCSKDMGLHWAEVCSQFSDLIYPLPITTQLCSGDKYKEAPMDGLVIKQSRWTNKSNVWFISSAHSDLHWEHLEHWEHWWLLKLLLIV